MAQPVLGGWSATTEQDTGGLLMIAGAPSSYAITGGDVENVNNCAGCWQLPNANVEYKYGAGLVTLPSYVACTARSLGSDGNTPPSCTENSSYSMSIANGNDWNPPGTCPSGIAPCFKQWVCHLTAYQKLYYTGGNSYVLPRTICKYGYDFSNNGASGGGTTCNSTFPYSPGDSYGVAQTVWDPANSASLPIDWEQQIYEADPGSGGNQGSGMNQC